MSTCSLTPNLDSILSSSALNLAQASRHPVKMLAATAMHTWAALSDLHTAFTHKYHKHTVERKLRTYHTSSGFLRKSSPWD